MEYKVSDSLKSFLNDLHVFRLGSSNATELDLLSAYDVMRAAGWPNGHKSKLDRYKLADMNHGIETACIRARWEHNQLHTMFGAEAPMCNLETARRLVCYVLRRNSKSQDEVKQVLENFGIPASMFESAITSQPEKDSIGMIARCIPFESIPQFNLGDYRIDLYFPDLRIAIECDENNHSAYDTTQEMKRHCFIREQLQCELIRYDPFAPNFSACDVIRMIVERISRRKT